MKRSIFTFICLLVLITSCTPTPQQQVVLVTATPWIVTATLAPTDTPTATPIATASHTPTPTLTNTPTPTPTRVLSLSEKYGPPKFTWKTDYENGMASYTDGFGGGPNYGGEVGVVPDPTGSGHGYVYRGHHEGPVALHPGEDAPNIRLHATMRFRPRVEGPHEDELDVYIYGDVNQKPGYLREQGKALCFMEEMTLPPGKNTDNTVLSLSVVPKGDGKNFIITMRTFDKNHTSLQPTYKNPNAPNFTFDVWHKVKVIVDADKSVSVYQDGILVEKGEWPSDMPFSVGRLVENGYAGEIFTNLTILTDNHVFNSYGN